ncbi:hypothetical protein A374_04374 [Fictibacillus macauensis ZFHKF-1]|uniref:Thioredoxin n=1 Tax=Fictibacillus macauensis ZFHKF-1 TaxID=1196324 RepID=I8AM81_9BACL|nr:thioredoxin family protein [Fictibacillus macauensis]EIT86779.1 hypothetical protein A374_04374 [Fictibacillus macauensis ZFHKF-1]
MKTLPYWFEKGMTKEAYIENMTTNQEELLSIEQNYTLSEAEVSELALLSTKKIKGVVLTADWCGDALLCVPVISKMAEAANIELSYLIRDENLELMDRYLTNGTARAIPKFIFFDEHGEEWAVWGPRSAAVQEHIMAERAKLPHSEDPDFASAQQVMYQNFRQRLSTDRELWQSVTDSVLTLFKQARKKDLR